MYPENTPQPQPYYAYPPVAVTAPKPPQHGLAVAGMVLGIVSLSLTVITFLMAGIITLPAAWVGLGLSAVAFASQKGHPRGIAKAGITLNIITTAIYVLWWILLAVGLIMIPGFMGN